MITLLIGAVLGLIPAAIAANKGRNFVGWWIYGTLLFSWRSHMVFSQREQASYENLLSLYFPQISLTPNADVETSSSSAFIL